MPISAQRRFSRALTLFVPPRVGDANVVMTAFGVPLGRIGSARTTDRDIVTFV
jgi:hypothetical protein